MDNEKINWVQKLSSRTLWITVAAILGSLAGSIAALSSASELVQTVGIACGIGSTAILAGVYVNGEKKLDAARVEANANTVQTINQTNVTATSASQKVVEKAFNTDAKAE